MIVSPFLFNRKTESESESDLGWAFIGLIGAGRIKEYVDDGADITRVYRHQLAACPNEVLPGPGKLVWWSVRVLPYIIQPHPVVRGADDRVHSHRRTRACYSSLPVYPRDDRGASRLRRRPASR